jgi:hypothetical protein
MFGTATTTTVVTSTGAFGTVRRLAPALLLALPFLLTLVLETAGSARTVDVQTQIAGEQRTCP